MKLSIINDIAETSNEFMYKVIDSVGCLEYDELMKRIDNVCNACTEHSDDTIDIDFKNMCFTVHKDNVLGMWHLCENASYYIIKGGLVHDTIDIELFD